MQENIKERNGVISQDVSEGFDEFLMMREVIKKSDLPKIDFSNTERAKATEYNPNGMITSSEKIAEMFERTLQALETIGVTKDDMQQITRDYVKMICFDYLTNQTDRNDGNYGILFKDGRASFAPLIDCDYILHDSSDKDNDINFTYSQRCDRDALMSFVASKYPELVQDFFNIVENNKVGISKIISDCFSTEMQEKYGNITSKNIDGLRRIIELVKQEKVSQTRKDEFRRDIPIEKNSMLEDCMQDSRTLLSEEQATTKFTKEEIRGKNEEKTETKTPI